MMDLTANVSFLNAFGTMLTAIATVLLVFVTYMQVLVTKKISKEVKMASEVRERQSNSRHVNEQWQRINLLAVTDVDFRNTAEGTYELGTNNKDIQTRGLLFYVLNILYDMFNVREGYIDPEFYKNMTDHHLMLLIKADRARLMEILEGERGYSHEFCDFIQKRVKQIENLPSS